MSFHGKVAPKGETMPFLAEKLANSIRHPVGAVFAVLGSRERWERWDRAACSRYYDSIGQTRCEEALSRIGLGPPLDLNGLSYQLSAATSQYTAGSPNSSPLSKLLASRNSTYAVILFLLVRTYRPSVVVETGVSQGLSSAAMLAAMRLNGHGELFSIDIKPLAELGSVVPSELRDRWHLLSGDSVPTLRQLLPTLEDVGIFVHDSLHTKENMLEEFALAEKAGAPVIVADNIELNRAFMDFFESDPNWMTQRVPYHYRYVMGIACRPIQSRKSEGKRS